MKRSIDTDTIVTYIAAGFFLLLSLGCAVLSFGVFVGYLEWTNNGYHGMGDWLRASMVLFLAAVLLGVTGLLLGRAANHRRLDRLMDLRR